MRSRIDWPIVFAVTSSIVKNTAAAIAVSSAPMLPIWLAKLWMNAFSVAVFVSVEELANMRVDRARDRRPSAPDP